MTKESMKTAKKKAHYISGTHWDREWYRPYQEFRMLLVKLLDDLIELMEKNKDFRYFQLDGQTCVLEDYVRIRPEMKGRLSRLIEDGRILVGPWYTMPDLFCVGDEALIRNLLMGRRISREWNTEPMPVGFICDMFGHPSQMPQIFAGFGISDVVLGRGTNESTTPMFFEWQSPDGTKSFVFKLQDSQGYGAFALPRAILEGDTFLDMAEFKADMKAAGGVPNKIKSVKEKHFRKELAGYVSHELKRCGGDTLCLMDSMDHIPPATNVVEYLKFIREACPEVEPEHSTLPMFFNDARKGVKKLAVKRGELREPSKERCGYLWLIPNCVSARVRMKQANDDCQNLIQKWAEPLVALSNLEGACIPEKFLEVAWEHIISNHAHDSICGCSIDQVHRDMMFRFDQAMVIGEQLKNRAMGHLTAEAADLAENPNEFTLAVFNPLPVPRKETVIFDVDLPADWPTEYSEGFFGQRVRSFQLRSSEGRNIPYQLLGFIPRHVERSRHAKFCYQNDGLLWRYTVAATLDLPSCGFTSFVVAPSTRPVRSVGTLRTGPLSGENEFISIKIASNGTVSLKDKKSGQEYSDLIMFEDVAETGDGWFHTASVNDLKCLSSACAAQVSAVNDGPKILSFRITVDMKVPARFDFASERRLEHDENLRISSLVMLKKGARSLEVETTIDNNIEDHQLKLLLPTDAVKATTYLAHHPFDFVERSIALDAGTFDWQEMERSEKPFLSIQSVGDGKRGLAFISPSGLHEGGVINDSRRTMQVTLLRSFRKTVSTSGESDGLEKGRIVLRYSLMPFAGELPRTEALDALAKMQAGISTRQTGSRASGFPPMSGKGPATQSFMEFSVGTLALSAVKPSESGDGIIVRVWNPGDKEGSGEISFKRKPETVELVSLAEEKDSAGKISFSGPSVKIKAPAHGIVTFKAKWGKR